MKLPDFRLLPKSARPNELLSLPSDHRQSDFLDRLNHLLWYFVIVLQSTIVATECMVEPFLLTVYAIVVTSLKT